MDRKGVICGVVGFLGLLSAATGFAAEATRIKASEVTQCEYPRTPAVSLGSTAVLTLLIAQVIISMATGCICCRRNTHPSTSSGTIAVICFILSWITFVIAFFLLLTAAALNDRHAAANRYDWYGNCYVVKPGVSAGGALLSLATVTLGMISYLALTSAKNNADQGWGNAPLPNQGGVAMGQPQFPPQTGADPVFVHEDTYMRRQFT
ncbi:uncharacterized protein LOC104430322 [Eucalyptus grandis]|uniref:Uncharacterized protein n=3 Tax=Eucalyptus grandis TaxID=71139 RepID=A0AAD9TA15_EUCGR|nr:uncharacterized protein LOC104430322 [Eucalyptus grandis]KAK2632021.1 hypothetical protein EUGRSUZ_L02108 [Eucalyptus grandis]